MFRTSWANRAFDRMQQLVRDHPEMKAGFIFTLESLTIELGDAADTFGESRAGNRRLGFVGVLSVLVRVDSQNRTARIIDVRLRRHASRG
ncbi:unnamed protein product [Gemmataceae bacterium]|nr:unnamed protein product [Gemmataceae bacterium]VTU01199.1 unnamed protein product [Gemmataceae bacterium]